jgi:predicted DNA binding CopG/RHH family protein
MSKKARINCFVSKEIKEIIQDQAEYFGLSIGGYISMLVRNEYKGMESFIEGEEGIKGAEE